MPESRAIIDHPRFKPLLPSITVNFWRPLDTVHTYAGDRISRRWVETLVESITEDKPHIAQLNFTSYYLHPVAHKKTQKTPISL